MQTTFAGRSTASEHAGYGRANCSLLVCRRKAAERYATGSQGPEEWAVAGQKAAAHREDVHALKGQPPRHHLHRGRKGRSAGADLGHISRARKGGGTGWGYSIGRQQGYK